ncbi:hypothetical protein HQ47_08305 [Porphyromonas macacae]|uniref:Uncharacterized protein n=1 Tax=Porphyromonas macacae TaxID=28115 RepID=A0A0A2E3I3_9PORP|nr:hypothetical protein HQ47_08305 [Porphyromonas macacae]
MFSYIYYRIYSTYQIKWKSDIAGVYAVAMLSIAQLLNLNAVIVPICYALRINFHPSKVSWMIVHIGFTVCNAIYFWGITNYEKLHNRWKSESKSKKRKNGYFVVLYLLISFVAGLAILHYLGNWEVKTKQSIENVSFSGNNSENRKRIYKNPAAKATGISTRAKTLMKL